MDCAVCGCAPTRRDISWHFSVSGHGSPNIVAWAGQNILSILVQQWSRDGRDGMCAPLASLASKVGAEAVPGSTFGDEMGWLTKGTAHEASSLWPTREVLCLARPRTNDYSVVTDRSRPRSPNIFPGKADDTTSCTFNWKPRPKENNAEPVRHLARLWPPPLPVQNQWSGFLSMWPNYVTQTQ